MAYRYTSFPPDAAMRLVVDAYWINEHVPSARGLPATHDRVLPDGCIDLIFQGHYRAPSVTARPRLFISALIEEPEPIIANPWSWYVGVRFRPAMAQFFTGLPSTESRNQDLHAPAVAACFLPLEHELAECRTPQAALTILRNYIAGRFRDHPHAGPPARVRRALSLLTDPVIGSGHVDSVAAALGLTQRSLHRDVVHWTGLAPKVFARIFRMQAALRALRTGRSGLATIAAETGYADQAHMTREFRRLTGATPAEHWAPVHV